MKKFIEKNKKFSAFLIIIAFTAVLYKGYKVIDSKVNSTEKEVVTLLLKNNEKDNTE